METRYAWSWYAPDWTGNLLGMQQRIRPGAVTLAGVHLYLPTVKGSPGIAVEVIDEQQPDDVTYTDFFAGTDTGSVATNFEDQGGATVNFGDINDPQDDADYARNSAAIGANDSAFLRFRGNNAGALAGKRILRVQIQALVMNRALSGNAASLPARGAWSDGSGAGDWYGNWRSVQKMDSYQLLPDLADWLLSPATGVPWTLTEVNNILDSGHAARFGIDVFGRAADEGIRVSAFWLRVWHCTDNRKGSYYRRGAPRLGWDRYVLSSTAALSANTYYWVAVSALTASLTNYFSLAYIYPMQGFPPEDATVSTQEHRITTGVRLSGPGGVAAPGDDGITGESETQFAALIDVAGTIQTQSQPYGEVNYWDFDTGTAGELRGQQVTSAGSQPAGGYAGITCQVGWTTDVQPDRPLVFSVRSGGGAISGGGVLEATATLRHDSRIDGTITDTFIKFDGGNWTPANSTQYHVLIASNATIGRGWRVPNLDTRSDAILSGSGTTVANVEGASQGGQTDSLVTNGTAFDRYEVPLAFTAPPTAPSGVTIETYDAVETGSPTPYSTLPPRAKVTWTASNLGAAFGGYHVWVRRHGIPAEVPQLVGDITPDAGGLSSPADTEDNNNEFWLYELAWSYSGGYYEDGFDVGVSAVNGTNKLETLITWADDPVTLTATPSSWLTSNAAPWLNTPLPINTREAPSDPNDDPEVFTRVVGRNMNVVRVTGRIPGRSYKLDWGSDVNYPDEFILDGVRNAAVSGRQMALLRCRGERAFGVVKYPSADYEEGRVIGAAEFWTTATPDGVQEERADANAPPGLVFNGTTHRIDHDDNTLLDPGTSAFTIMLYAELPAASSKTHLSKRAGADGYEIVTSSGGANQVILDGASGTCTLADAVFVGLGTPVVYVATSPGSGTGTKVLYRDGEVVDTDATNHGSISNSEALNLGGDGGALFTALGPLHAYGVWLRELDADEVARLTYYCQGHAGAKVPPGASLFVDLRDWAAYASDGVFDLSGNELNGTWTGDIPLQGIPWQLHETRRRH